MAYLTFSDYRKKIQTANLNQIIGSDNSILELEQKAAQNEAATFLSKYDLSLEFADTLPYDNSRTYNAGERCVLDFATYDSTKSYMPNNLVVNAGAAYICATATTGTFDVTKWTLLGNQYDFFYITYPAPVFDATQFYNVGDKVFFKNNVYTCKVATLQMSSSALLQYKTYANAPALNIFPNDINRGLITWGAPTLYNVVAGTLPTNAAKWTKGDNRDSNLVDVILDIAIYKAHRRIAPANIPAQREMAYMGAQEDRYKQGGELHFPPYCAIGKLQRFQSGDLSLTLPEIQQPDNKERGNIRYGGNVKINNVYAPFDRYEN